MLKLVGKRVGIVPDPKKEETTASGLYIPQTVAEAREQNPTNVGTVKYVSEAVTEDIKPGDRVVYVEGTYWKNGTRVHPDEILVEDETLIIVQEHEVLVVIR